jgi:hypothetical protein
MNAGWQRAITPARQAGTGWLEVAAVAVVISVLAGTLLLKLLDYQLLAQQTATDLIIANMRTGLRFRVAALIVAGRTQEIGGLAGANPVDFLDRPPAGYLGELGADDGTRDLPPGHWFFDIRKRELIYVVNKEDGSASPGGGEKLMRLRVVAKGLNSRESPPAVSIQVGGKAF